MKSTAKRTFYPSLAVEKVLRTAPTKKVSDRVNELIMKGLLRERDEAIRAEYERFGREAQTQEPRKKNSDGISSTMMMAAKLFETEGSNDEDLI